jgi:hypothetical protein
MTITAVGSLATGSGTTLAVAPTAVGDLLVVTVIEAGFGETISGGGVTTWTRLTEAPTGGGIDVELWAGLVTTTGSSTITVTASAAGISAQQFHHTGAAGWQFDTVATPNSTAVSPGTNTGNFPTVTPTGSAELWVGAAFCDVGGTVTGSTSGVTYDSWSPTSTTAAFAYNLSATGAQAPNWSVSPPSFSGVLVCVAVCIIPAPPPPLAPTLDSPIASAVVDAAAGMSFVNTYNTGGAAGGQTAYHLRLKVAGAGSYTYWNGTAFTGTDGPVTGTSGTVTIPAAVIADGQTYVWSVASVDGGGEGPYAADATFVAQAAPSVSVTAPTGTIATEHPTVTWTETLASGASQISYQVRTFTQAQTLAGGFNPATSACEDDSGVLTGGGPSALWRGPQLWRGAQTWRGLSGSPSYTIVTGLGNGTYISYVNVIQTGPQASGFTPGAAYTISLPAAPTVTVSAPTGTVATPIPVVAWSATFAGGQAQTAYRVITYSAAQYSAGGFVPGVGPYLDDSGPITGTVTNYRINTLIPNGTVARSYVFVTQTAGNTGSAFSGFTVSFVPMQLPTVHVIVNVQDNILQAPNTVNDYDITQFVNTFETHMGRQHELDRPEAGSCTVTVDNRTGIFTPWNTASPLYGIDGAGMVPGKTLKITCDWMGTTYERYYGYTDNWTPGPADAINDTATITATDILALLALAPISNTTLYQDVVIPMGSTGYFRCNDPAGSTQAADFSGSAHPAGLVTTGGSTGATPTLTFGDQDPSGTQATALLSSTSSGSGSGALLYDPATCLTINCPLTSFGYIQGGIGYGASDPWSISLLFQGNNGSCEGSPIVSAECASAAWVVGICANYAGQADGTLMVALDVGFGWPLPTFFPGNLVNDGNWHHLVLTSAGGTAGFDINLDNVLITTGFAAGQETTPFPANFFIGIPSFTTVPTADGLLANTLTLSYQEVAQFNYELTGTQVNELYAPFGYMRLPEFTGQRIETVLKIIGYIGGTYSYPTDIDTGTVFCQGETTSQVSGYALDYLLNCSDTELGFLYQRNDRTLVFDDANYTSSNPTSNTPQAYLTDNVTVLGSESTPRCYYLVKGLQIGVDDLDLWNDVQVQAQQCATSGQLQELTNALSILWYGLRILKRTGLLFAADSGVASTISQALILLDRYASPQVRVPAVTLGAEANSGGNIPTMLGTFLWDELAISRGGPGVPVGSGLIAQAMLIESISDRYDAAPGTYRTTYSLSPFEVTAS